MNRYLVSVQDPSGPKRTEIVEADSPEAAAAQARALGWEDVRLRVRAPVEELFPNQRDVSLDLVRVAVDAPRMSRWRRILAVGWLATRKMWKIWVLGCFAFGLKWAYYRYSSIDIVAIGCGTLIPFALAAWSEWFGVLARFRHISWLASWGRWEEVLDRLPRLQGLIPAENYIAAESNALAGAGQLNEALELLHELKYGDDDPRHWAAMSTLHSIAQRDEDAILFAERAIALDPDNPVSLLATAYLYLSRTQDPRRPRELLDRAERFEISEDLQPKYCLVAGAIALTDGDALRARKFLQESLNFASELANVGPEYSVLADLAHGYLCLAEHKLGNPVAASEHEAAAVKRLTALRANKLLDRIAKASQN